MKQRNKKQKQTGYRRFLTVLCTVCAIILAVGAVLTGVLWSQLSRYDVTMPQYPVEEFLSKLQSGDITTAISLAKVDMKQFDDTNDCLRYMDTLFDDGKGYADTSWRKAKTDGDKETYNIYCGDERVMTVTVAPTPEKGVYDRTVYGIASSSFFPIKDIRVTVPAAATLRVDGKEVDSTVKVEQTAVTDAYKGLEEANCPAVKTYVLSGLLEYPEITVTDANGGTYLPFATQDKNATEEVELDEKSGKPLTMTYYRAFTDEQKVEFEALTDKAAKTYARYITRKASLYTLRTLILRSSTFYKDMGEYDNTWFSYSYNQEFSDEEIFDIRVYDDTHFTADIKMTMSMRMTTGPRKYDLHYRVAYVKENDKWYIAYLATIGSMETIIDQSSSQTPSAQG